MDYSLAWLDYGRQALHDADAQKRLGYADIGRYYLSDELRVVARKQLNAKTKVAACMATVQKEYQIGLRRMLGSVTVELVSQPEEAGICFSLDKTLATHGYVISAKENAPILVRAADTNGILYAVYDILRRIAMQIPANAWNKTCIPSHPLRMLNHWDNMDGSIERGYSGRSFFFANDEILIDGRTVDYARLVSSVGINAVVINNVNVRYAATELITHRYYEKLRKMSEIFAVYGISLYLSLNYASVMELGGLDTSDPLDARVIAWWTDKMREVYENIPKLGGFLVKADSEGRPGPFTYGRNHADGANMLARAILPYGGKIIWRCFVYNCQQDWRDRKTDRARSGYDHFMPLDGQFLDNVILQIKNGPMDFQVREPVHPLFGGLKKTNQMLEVQIAQEYTGQQRHVCYLLPMFQQVLGFRTYLPGRDKDTVEDIISGCTFRQKNCGIAAVANTGNDYNWTGHDFAAANLYGFGRLAFDANLSAEEIAREWAMLTFGCKQQVVDTVVTILMQSWKAYESYTSPLGIGWMVNPSHHYGPNVEGYEFDRWGTYHRADWRGIGVDRSSQGTGYAMQYNEPNASMYEKIETCPEELLLFFHYVPYTHVLKNKKTLIQHIYDTHFEGADTARSFLLLWESVKDQVEPAVYERVLSRLQEQAESAVEWRDRINTYFYRRCGISDAQGRTIY